MHFFVGQSAYIVKYPMEHRLPLLDGERHAGRDQGGPRDLANRRGGERGAPHNMRQLVPWMARRTVRLEPFLASLTPDAGLGASTTPPAP
jgi:hypothetical protein